MDRADPASIPGPPIYLKEREQRRKLRKQQPKDWKEIFPGRALLTCLVWEGQATAWVMGCNHAGWRTCPRGIHGG